MSKTITEPKFEHGLTETLADILKDIKRSRMVTSGTNRLGTVKLDDGREAQIHLIVTTDETEFLDEW